MKKSIIVLALAALSLSACQKFQEAEGGMLYKIVKDNGQEKIKEGDFVSFGAIIKTGEDSTALINTYDSGHPSYMAVQKPMFNGDIMSAFLKLGSGDSAIFKLNADSMVAHGMQKPEGMKTSHMIYEIKINHVIPKGELTDSIFHAQVEDYIKVEQEKVKNAETGNIKAFIDDNKLTVKSTASGMQYVIEKEGKGPIARVGDSAKVNYTGSFLSGKVFDTSIKEVALKEKNIYNAQRPYEPLVTQVGSGQLLLGWDEALTTFPEGTKVKIILPSKLGYGEQGSMQIGPYTPLVFDMEIVDVIPQKGDNEAQDPATK